MSVKKMIIGMALVGASLCGLKATNTESNVNATNKNTIAQEALTPEQKQKALDQAIRDERPRQEIVRYIDFPAGIPVTKEGAFDPEMAEKQAELLWQEKGALLQEFSDAVKLGAKPEEAYVKIAHKLAAGDKEKEQQILAVYDGVQKAHKNLNGHMKRNVGESAIAGLITCIVIAGMGKLLRESDILSPCFEKIVAYSPMFVAGIFVGVTVDVYDRPKAFVEAQQAVYNAYVDQTIENKAKAYETVSMKQARELIKQAQKKDAVSR